LKRKAVAVSQQVYARIDSSKIGHEDLSPFAQPGQICCLYTDAGIGREREQKIKPAGISLTICHSI
jgi:DeoR/GlpR family transcriptional regulator of sugar metabolism